MGSNSRPIFILMLRSIFYNLCVYSFLIHDQNIVLNLVTIMATLVLFTAKWNIPYT